jgi:hypothetical protein
VAATNKKKEETKKEEKKTEADDKGSVQEPKSITLNKPAQQPGAQQQGCCSR